ncbi:MAG TPA: hypothetical protein PKC21_04360 [Oligoflexia bacterium]|nr:hypothetical protein [Oligoflexia bacterium]HMR24572.1 hypothetical protein [Oligoflexia bacterium]
MHKNISSSLMKKNSLFLTLIYLILGLTSSCSNNQFGSVRMVLSSGEEQEVRIDKVDCFNVFYGDDNNGGTVNGMTCVLQFKNGTDLNNTITFKVYDLIHLHDTYLNENLDPFVYPMDSVDVIINGNTNGVLNSSIVNFSKITNTLGGEVCMKDFYLNLGFGGTTGFIEGNFCTQVQTNIQQ